MISFDGIYRLRGPRKARLAGSNSTTACAWHVRIIDFGLLQPEVHHLRPHTVVAIPAEEGIFKSNCAETLGKNICRDFDLHIDRIRWIEFFPNLPQQIYVASFSAKSTWGAQVFYSITWHPIRSNELSAIQPFIPETARVNPPRQPYAGRYRL